MNTNDRSGMRDGPARPRPSEISRWRDALLDAVRPGGIEKTDDPSPPTVLGGRYQLLHRLGSGGMGTIWCAEHVGVGRRVAIKFLHEHVAGDPRARRRFVREGRLAASVHHPRIVDVLDAGETDDGRAFLVMELLGGRTLADHVLEQGPPSAAEARELLQQLADGLAHVHAHGVVHRDLKPSNVMLLPGEPLRCKLIDFGLAGATEASVSLTQTGQLLGSPAYMSPEQFRGEEVDARSDIYSLGCIAYFMLVGKRPFDGRTPAEVMYQHRHRDLPRPSDPGVREASDELWPILVRACAKAPSQRYASAQALGEALRGDARSARSPSRTTLWLTGGLLALGSLGAASLVRPPSRGARIEPTLASLMLPAVAPPPGAATVRSVHAGDAFTCAVLDDDTVRCWGRQGPHLCQPAHAGHIGDDELPSTVPALHLGPPALRTLHTEYYASHVCAVLDDDSLRCWGDDRFDQLGNGPAREHWCDGLDESVESAESIAIPTPIDEVHLHQYGTCALAGADDARGIYCWGYNRFGQAGLGHRTPLPRPHTRPAQLGDAEVASMGMGIHTACARLDGGGVRCWGANHSGQLGADFPRDAFVGDGRGDGARGQLPDSDALNVRGLEDFDVAALRVNGGWNCVLSTAGAVRCWGGNHNGTVGLPHHQIPACDPHGDGSDCFVESPERDVDLGDVRVVDLQLGRRRACTLDDEGAVRCWGWGERGALGYGPRLLEATGHPDIGLHLSPAEAYAAMGNGGVVDIGDFDGDGRIDRVLQLTMGYSHTCVLVEDGSVRCWGSNAEGQLGYGTTEDVGDDETPAEYYARHECGAVPIVPGVSGVGCSVEPASVPTSGPTSVPTSG